MIFDIDDETVQWETDNHFNIVFGKFSTPIQRAKFDLILAIYEN